MRTIVRRFGRIPQHGVVARAPARSFVVNNKAVLMMREPPSVVLTEKEHVLCTLLDRVCHWLSTDDPATRVDGTELRFSQLRYAANSGTRLLCEARIAGGWVRDKLLERNSDDLDISISTLTGHTFALFLRQYLDSSTFRESDLSRHMATLAQSVAGAATPMGHIGKIDANPEQSKNLETATARVMDLSLDFVNLRKEVYEGDSRIPTMSFGTPQEDAERRDITINSLFFNTHTREVEDWTGHGLSDLRQGVVRTPLAPAATFTDDPLRILRCVRFASRFGYTVQDDIIACLRGDAHQNIPAQSAQQLAQTLRHALSQKVSRERFGIEVDKMLLGHDPLRSLELLSAMQIYDIVFHPPPSEGPLVRSEDGATSDGGATPQSETAALATAKLLGEAVAAAHGTPLEQLPNGELLSHCSSDWLAALAGRSDSATAQYHLWASVALIPLQRLYTVGKKGRLTWAGENTITAGLKLPVRKTKDPVVAMYKSAQLLRDPRLDRFPAPEESATQRLTRKSAIGLLLRQPCITNATLGLSLPSVLLFAFLLEIQPLWLFDGQALTLDKTAAAHIADEYSTFWRAVQDWRLEALATEKPLLDGNRIHATLQCERQLIGRIQPYVIAWQIDHADASQSLTERQDACAAWLKQSAITSDVRSAIDGKRS